MATPQAGSILRQLRQAALRHDGAGMTDGQLLGSFLSQRDEAAFHALVRRHGPMVRGVCRRVLRNSHDADDAFQAVFLVLLRKAASLSARQVVGDWLHGVAYHTALKARAAEAHRRTKERQILRREAIEDERRPDWHAVLDQEIGRLPEKYRLPVVLCDLEGRTRKQAALQLGWREGTISGRLARARTMLARRLTRRGVTLSAGGLAALLTQEAFACLPVSLVHFPLQAAEAVPAKIAALTEGVVRAMLLAKLKPFAVLLSSTLVLAVGIGAWRHAATAGQDEERREEKPVPADRLADRPKIPVAPRAGREFQVDLRIIKRGKDGQKELATPRLLTREGKKASFAVGKEYALSAGGGKVESLLMGPTVQLVVYSEGKSQICLDMTLNHPTTGIFATDDVTVQAESVRVIRKITLGEFVTAKLDTGGEHSTPLEVTASVREANERSDAKTIAVAENDLKMAEFYRRTGHPGSARFYYNLIQQRYPGTVYYERACERIFLMAQLNRQADKPAEAKEDSAARVGQIFIIGNTKTKQEVILDQVPLFPGQFLKDEDVRAAQRNLSRLKVFKNAKISVIGNDDSAYKDIKITVEEK